MMWKCGSFEFDTRKPVIMGILNVTPDSFSDGGTHNTPEAALAWAQHMLDEGAHMIDVGGESTRPGSAEVSVEEETARVLPVVRALAEQGVCVSVDTRHAEVARACLEAGAAIINDVSGFRDPAMVQVAAASNCGVVVKGDADLLVHLAHCCNPVAGDDIVGFITRGRGVSVHRASCPNVADLARHPERLIDVEWDASGATEFRVEIVVEATDRMGLLKDVTIAIGDAGGNILSAATQTSSQGIARLRFLVSISDASLLDALLATVSRVPSVYDARRLMPGEGASQQRLR